LGLRFLFSSSGCPQNSSLGRNGARLSAPRGGRDDVVEREGRSPFPFFLASRPTSARPRFLISLSRVGACFLFSFWILHGIRFFCLLLPVGMGPAFSLHYPVLCNSRFPVRLSSNLPEGRLCNDWEWTIFSPYGLVLRRDFGVFDSFVF